MTPGLILLIVIIYFLVLMTIAYFTKGDAGNDTFFAGNRSSKWYLVAFGMIGASLSGVTFLSVPGKVANDAFSYMQLVLGFLLGYAVIAFILIPIYYRMNLYSIYEYLGDRFGKVSHKTGSIFFLISRLAGASLRIFLVAGVLHHFVFASFGFPFLLTTIITILLIWVYTFQGGIKTIVITDTLQTAFMIIALLFAFYFVLKELNLGIPEVWELASNKKLTKTFYFNDFMKEGKHFYKLFFSGMFTAIVMTGLDQDMMQKNLSCKNQKDAQKNVLSLSILLVPINFLFVSLGAFLVIYAQQKGIILPDSADHLFPEIALNHFPIGMGVIFLLGLIAAAYSSADSALTSLTTAFCVDFLNMHKTPKENDKITRFIVHFVFSVIIVLIVWMYKLIDDRSIVDRIYQIAGYTYGPLLGLFSFGIFTKFKVRDTFVPIICVVAPILSYVVAQNSLKWFGYKFSFELLLLNGLLTFLGLLLITKFKYRNDE